MRVFFYDRESKRHWHRMLGEDAEALTWRDDGFVKDPCPRDIVVCHRVGVQIESRLRQLAAAGTYVVRVSGSDRTVVPPVENFYDRAWRVDEPEDSGFATTFALFKGTLLDQGYPTWNLLEPDGHRPAPDALLALHLLGLLGECPVDIQDAAKTEAIAIAGSAEGAALHVRNTEARGAFIRKWCV